MSNKNVLKDLSTNDIDCGQRAINFLFESTMIDECWSIREKRAFKWWGHRLAQKVWTEPHWEDAETLVSLVHVETDFLRNVQDSDETYDNLHILQLFNSLYGFIYVPEEKKIKLHTTLYVHEGNYDWTSKLLLGASGLQVSYADSRVESLATKFNEAEPDITPHPDSGFRGTPDEMVSIMNWVASQGKTRVNAKSDEIKKTCDLLSASCLAVAGKDGLTAEFPFIDNEPAVARFIEGKDGVGTSLFTVNKNMPHLGLLSYGVQFQLLLPPQYPKQIAYRLCNQLNLNESRQWARCHMLGSWTARPNIDNMADIVYVTFLPAACYRPGLIANLALSNGVRSMWAKKALNTAKE